MNGFPKRAVVDRIKAEYPKGTRVELIEMDDPYRNDMLPGLKGTVMEVDDIATVHIAWDNGCHLGAAFGVDRMPTATPAVSPAVSSTIGLKDLVIAPLVTDTEETLTYGDLQKVAGAIEASVTPGNADADVQYADDAEFSVLYPDPEVALKTKLADIPLSIQESIFGNHLDSNGVLIRSATDTPPYYAVGFMSEKSNHKYRYVWLYKVRAKPVTENYSTKEGTKVTRQTGEIEWTAIKRTHDGQYQAVADEGENGFTAAKAETFLQSVYTPTFTPPSP